MNHKLISILGMLLCFICILTPIRVQAEDVVPIGGNDDKVGFVTVNLKKNGTETGSLEFTLKATEATTSVKWRTIGFYITKNTTDLGSSNKAAYKNIIWLTEKGCNVTEDTADNQKYTKFVIDGDAYDNILYKLGVTSEDKYVYLQGVLQGYTYRYGNMVAVTKNCYTYNAMKSTCSKIGWATSCYAGWKSRYNIKVPLDTRPQKMTFNYYIYTAGSNSSAKTTYTQVGTYNNSDNKTKWTSVTNGCGSIQDGNGLHFKLLQYRVLQSTVHVSTYNAPKKLSGVLKQSNLNKYVKSGDNYYLVGVRAARQSQKVDATNGMRFAVNKNYRKQYTGKVLNADGSFTQNYLDFYSDLTSIYYEVLNDSKGMEINLIYKKAKPSTSKTSGTNEQEDMELTTRAVIDSDSRGNETYNSQVGIPTTKTQYVNVFTKDFLYKYAVKQVVGSRKYAQLYDSTEVVNGESKTTQKTEYVERDYSYWKVESIGVWKLTSATVNNYSLPNESLNIYTSSSYKAPTVTYAKTGRYDDPDGVGTYHVGQMKVWNDTVVINGITILNGARYFTSTPASKTIQAANTCEQNTLFTQNQIIEALKANGEYDSEGTVTYSS